jgi:hypothetical protein
VDDSLRARYEALSKKIIDAAANVTARLEDEVHDMAELGRVHQTVADIATEYKELMAQTPEGEKMAFERSHGRRVLDLKRLDGQLPHQIGGQAAKKAIDATTHGSPFLFRRDPPKHIEVDITYTRGEPKYHIGGDVDAWCGTCGESTAHAILAIVGGQPKQVMCRICDARHNYRTEPARKRGAAAAPAKKGKLTQEQVESNRREQERFALTNELANAENPRPFVPRERYKAGEIIVHPEYGRGKIDAVVRGAIVVKFRDGVRSLSLF